MAFFLGYMFGVASHMTGLTTGVTLIIMLPILSNWKRVGLLTCFICSNTLSYSPDFFASQHQHQFYSSGKSPKLTRTPTSRFKTQASPKSFCLTKPDIFFQKICFDHAHPQIPSYLASIRSSLQIQINKMEWYSRSMAEALFLGEKLPSDLRPIFQRSGLYHVVVVSGFHMSFFGMLMKLLFLFPMRIGLAYKIIGPLTYNVVEILILSFIAVGIFHYAWLVGMGPAAQRASLLFILGVFHTLVYPISFQNKCLATLLIQICVFPFSFLSVGNLMSWMAYLCVCKAPKIAVFLLFVFSYILFDQNEWIQVPINLFVLPIFSIIIPFLAVAIFLEPCAVIAEWFLQQLFQYLALILNVCEHFYIPLGWKPWIVAFLIIILGLKYSKGQRY